MTKGQLPGWNGMPIALPPIFANTTATTDANGYVTVAHGGSAAPAVIIPNAHSYTYLAVLSAADSTTFTVRCITLAGAAVASTSVGFGWVAYF